MSRPNLRLRSVWPPRPCSPPDSSLSTPPRRPRPPPLTPIALEGDVARGAVLAETCKGCHGVPESHNAYPSYHVPKLGGQNADYIEVALQGYRRGTRSHPTMQAQAASLQRPRHRGRRGVFRGARRRGRARPIERVGARDRGRQPHRGRVRAVPRRRAASRDAPQWPNLAGQHESYLLQALQQYQTGQRSDVLMAPIIAGLDATALNELAAYFSSQPHLHQTPTE